MAKRENNKIGVALLLPTKVAELLIRGQTIHDTMGTNSKTLPTPSPTLAVLQADINALTAKQVIAKTRVAGAVTDRNAAEKVLRVDLNNERGYVELLANADPTNAAQIAQDAGMLLRKSGARSKPPLATKPGPTTGVVHVIAKATKGAQANDWQLSTDGGKTWLDLPSTTKAAATVSNLTPATTVQFRHRVLTKVGTSDWSTPVPHVVA